LGCTSVVRKTVLISTHYDNSHVYNELCSLLQATFDGIDETVHEYTTETQIIPDTFPFPECSGSGRWK
jgi:hypothetical protein